MFSSWRDVYDSDLQGLYALIALPALFLIARLASPRRVVDGTGRFVRAWSLVFAVETIADPVVTGPLLHAFVTQGPLADYGMIPFVLLGDFRVFLLVLFVAAPDAGLGSALTRAAAWTLLVPAIAWSTTAALRAALGDVPPTTIWLVYESAFAALALVLRARARDRYCRAVLAYVAVYYALWAAADGIILAGVDAGWALRIVPNQLYYAFFVPFAEVLFFAPRYAASSTSTQAAR